MFGEVLSHHFKLALFLLGKMMPKRSAKTDMERVVELSDQINQTFKINGRTVEELATFYLAASIGALRLITPEDQMPNFRTGIKDWIDDCGERVISGIMRTYSEITENKPR